MPLTEDFDIFFSTDVFASDAIYDGASEVKVIFDRAYANILDIASRDPQAIAKESDFADPVGKTLEIDATVYTIVDTEPDGTGMTTLRLRAP